MQSSLKAILRHLGFIPILPNTSMVLAALSLQTKHFFAEQFNVTTRTIRNWVKYLEEMHALVKIPVTGRVCAYALNPHEVWKGYDNAKPYAAFLTKTLVNKDGEIQRRIMAMQSRSVANLTA